MPMCCRLFAFADNILYLHALVTRACLETTEPFPEMATQAQWNSEKYSSTLSRWMSTEASVYLTPVSGSTWSSRAVGSTASELHWKYTLKAWATRQWRVAGLALMRNVSKGSFRKMGMADWPGSVVGSTSGSSFWLEPPKGGTWLATSGVTLLGIAEESSFGTISLRSSGKLKKG